MKRCRNRYLVTIKDGGNTLFCPGKLIFIRGHIIRALLRNMSHRRLFWYLWYTNNVLHDTAAGCFSEIITLLKLTGVGSKDRESTASIRLSVGVIDMLVD